MKARILDESREVGPTWRAAVYIDPRDNQHHIAPMLAVDKQAAFEIADWWYSYLVRMYGEFPALGTVRTPEGV